MKTNKLLSLILALFSAIITLGWATVGMFILLSGSSPFIGIICLLLMVGAGYLTFQFLFE